MTLFTACETQHEKVYEDIEQGKMEVLMSTICEIDTIVPDTADTNCDPLIKGDMIIEDEIYETREFKVLESDSMIGPPDHHPMKNGGMAISKEYYKYLDDILED